MSYAGSIGSFMNGSGLETALQTIAKATRGHILVEFVLSTKLQQLLQDDEDGSSLLTSENMEQIENTYENVRTNKLMI